MAPLTEIFESTRHYASVLGFHFFDSERLVAARRHVVEISRERAPVLELHLGSALEQPFGARSVRARLFHSLLMVSIINIK